MTIFLFRLNKIWFKMRQATPHETSADLWMKYLADSSAIIISSRQGISQSRLNLRLEEAALEKIKPSTPADLEMSVSQLVDIMFPTPKEKKREK